MYMCILSNMYRIGKVRIEYVSYLLLTISFQPYKALICKYLCEYVVSQETV